VDAALTLGRVLGIRIELHWSLLVAAVLVVWTLASGVFPQTNPDLSGTAHAAMAVVATLVFFGSVVLHELGHAVQARREGMEIEEISLWLFGGVAVMKQGFPGPGTEFRVAVAGPLVSLWLGVAFLAAALVPGLPEAVDGVVAWLAYVNLVLLVFNLVPAAPLDGGRMLHAALWWLKRDLVRATRVTTGLGRGFGFLLIAGGLALLVFEGSFSGAWLAFLGWFLLAAATAESRALTARDALDGLHVGDVMDRDPVTVTPDVTLDRIMDDVGVRRRHTTYPVVENGSAVGLLPLARVGEVPPEERSRRVVHEYMLPRDELTTLEEGRHVFEALAVLARAGEGRALVLSGTRLVGVLSLSDIARGLEQMAQGRAGLPGTEV
jgi:Zn-dependent protease/CBS domain-containing protein